MSSSNVEETRFFSAADVGLNGVLLSGSLTSKGLNVVGMNAIDFIINVTRVGSTTVTGVLQGSLDNLNWYDLMPDSTTGTSTFTNTSSASRVFAVGFPYSFGHRINTNFVRLATLTGAGASTDTAIVTARAKRFLG